MTQIFDDEGRARPATILKAEPVVVVQLKTKEKDGYTSVQIGSGARKDKNVSKSVKGHTKDLGNFAILKEFRVEETASFDRGSKISVDSFAPGDKIALSSVSKGKGFQGVVKRHGFHGGPRSHGQKHSEREPGSIGGSGGRAGGRVAKGMRMAGRMGSDKVTLKNVKVLQVDQSQNLLMVAGSVPGRRGTIVELRSMN